jgi:hypothetical protein
MMSAHHYFFFTTGFLLGLGRALAWAVLSFSTLRPSLTA